MKTLLSAVILAVAPLQNIYTQDLFNKWIKTNAEFIDQRELSNENPLKYQYVKYTFEKPNKVFIGLTFDTKIALFFEKVGSEIKVKNSSGFQVNDFLVEKLSSDELILIQKGRGSFRDSDCIRLFFDQEKRYQNSIAVRPSDIFSISDVDTIYKASEKIYPEFNSDKSFYEFCSDYISEKKAVMSTNNFFLATFIIRKSGAIDNVQVLEKINDRFEKQFRTALKKSERLWTPGQIGDKNVDTQMKATFKFVSSGDFLFIYDFLKKGKLHMANFDFAGALYYFDQILEKDTSDIETLYNKAICELKLGNKEQGCLDLRKVSMTGKYKIEDLILSECNSN
jgi:hypothetical protein